MILAVLIYRKVFTDNGNVETAAATTITRLIDSSEGSIMITQRDEHFRKKGFIEVIVPKVTFTDQRSATDCELARSSCPEVYFTW